MRVLFLPGIPCICVVPPRRIPTIRTSLEVLTIFVSFFVFCYQDVCFDIYLLHKLGLKWKHAAT